MTNSTIISRRTVMTKSLATIVAVIAAVALPQVFHAIGALSGAGAAIGATFLPMHIPVLLAGLLFGPIVGVAAGIASPVISFAMTGMPTAVLLPFMVIELAVYGLCSGLLSKAKMNTFSKLIITQISGRGARAIAVLAAIFIFGNEQLTVSSIGAFITAGLFGIVLQWAFIPLFTDRINTMRDKL